MGDRFYQQRKAAGMDKPKRILKKDWIDAVNKELGVVVLGLDKLTIETLKSLLEAIQAKTDE